MQQDTLLATSDDGSRFIANYLSPHKVAILALVEIYCALLLPPRHTTHILSLVIDHINVKDRVQLTLQQLEKETEDRDSSIPDCSISHLLLKKLWEIHSFDEFYQFMSGLTKFLVQQNTTVPVNRRLVLLSPTSVLGRFIKRSWLEFSKMTFEESVHLWKAFIAYRASSLGNHHSLVNITPDLEGFADHPHLVRHAYNRLEPCTPVFDSDRFAENAIQNMQRTGCPVPEETLALINTIRLPQQAVPASNHYMKFIHSWKSGDYQATFDNLHRYFDYTMQSRDRFYQYALLNLAIVQADFGSTQEATWAIQESINTARENKDYSCLNFALAWLHQFQKSRPIVQALSDTQIISYLEKQSNPQYGLQSSTHLFKSKKIIEQGGPTLDAFEALFQSSKINHLQPSNQLRGMQTLLCSEFWERLGHKPTSMTHIELFSMHYSDIASCEDLIRLRCSYALQSKSGKLPEAVASIHAIGKEMHMSNQTRKIWALYAACLQIRLALNSIASTILEQVSPLLDIDGGLRLVIELLKVEYLKKSLDLPAAFDAVNSIREEYGRKADILDQVTIEVFFGELLLETEEPWKALSLISRQIMLAEKHRLYVIRGKAVVVLADVLLQVHEAEEALVLLDGVMSLILQQEDKGLEGRATELYAECLLKIPSNTKSNYPKELVLQFYERALQAYSDIEDIEQSIRVTRRILQNSLCLPGNSKSDMENTLNQLEIQQKEYSKQPILTPLFTFITSP